MSEYTAERLEVIPYLDMEKVMTMSQESRIGGAVLEQMMRYWEAWIPELTIRKLTVGKISYLLVGLSEKVEADVDKVWEDAPSDAFLYNVLAQVMCMGVIHDLLPEVEDAGCAPSPRPTDALMEALAAEGFPYKEKGPALSRRYAVVTHYPFKGGCEICYMQKDCPKGQGAGEGGRWDFPGYEREQN